MAKSAHDITDGLPDGAFDHLSARDRARLIKLMARLAERSYRRGFQQGTTKGDFARPQMVAGWRFRRSTDKSPWLDQPGRVEDSRSRLFMENHGLERIGFREEKL
jgi:hypothetical protein